MKIHQKINIFLQNDHFRDIQTEKLHKLAEKTQQFYYKNRHTFYKQSDQSDYIYINLKGEIGLTQYYDGCIPYAKQSIIKIVQNCDLKNDYKGLSTNLYNKINKIIDTKGKTVHPNTQKTRVLKKFLKKIGPNQVFGDDGILDQSQTRYYECYAMSPGLALKIHKQWIYKILIQEQQQQEQEQQKTESEISLSFMQLLDFHISELDKIKAPKPKIKPPIKKPKLIKNLNFLKGLYKNRIIQNNT